MSKAASNHIQQILNGLIGLSKPFTVLEFRGMSAEAINYTSKKDGKAAVFEFVSYACESLGPDARGISVRVEKPADTIVVNKVLCNKDGTPVPLPFRKGDRVLVVIKGMQEAKGVLSMDAASVALYDEPAS